MNEKWNSHSIQIKKNENIENIYQYIAEKEQKLHPKREEKKNKLFFFFEGFSFIPFWRWFMCISIFLLFTEFMDSF